MATSPTTLGLRSVTAFIASLRPELRQLAAAPPLTAWRSWPRGSRRPAHCLPAAGAAGDEDEDSGLVKGGLPRGPEPAGGLFGS